LSPQMSLAGLIDIENHFEPKAKNPVSVTFPNTGFPSAESTLRNDIEYVVVKERCSCFSKMAIMYFPGLPFGSFR